MPWWMCPDCTEYYDDRVDIAEIVGGNNASYPVPWQVSVQRYNWQTHLKTHFCGATILDDSTLLSAAHCFDNYNGISDISYHGIFIRAGSVSKTSGGQVS